MPRAANCPEAVVCSLYRYVVLRRPAGGFLRAVLSNDLMEAFGRADVHNTKAMADIAVFVYQIVPSCTRGSAAAVSAWLDGDADPGWVRHSSFMNALRVHGINWQPPADLVPLSPSALEGGAQ